VSPEPMTSDWPRFSAFGASCESSVDISFILYVFRSSSVTSSVLLLFCCMWISDAPNDCQYSICPCRSCFTACAVAVKSLWLQLAAYSVFGKLQ
jgi:hypothetical protein